MRRQYNRLIKEGLVTSAAVLLSYFILSHTDFLHHAKTTVQDVYDSHLSSTSGRKQFIILLAGSRTGSSFLGQLFNQNPNLLYIHEPFAIKHLLDLRERGFIPEADERSTVDELQIFWLRQVLDRCDTGDMPLHPQLEKWGRCGLEGENLLRFGKRQCNETFTDTSRSELCILRSSVVLKISRLLQLNWLNRISEAFTGHDVKIIHLLRDPRDVIKSRFRFKHYYYKDRFPITHTLNMEHKVGLAAEEWCVRELDTLLYAERNPPPWLANNYRLVRFEDLVSNPLAVAEDLYDFIGYDSIPVAVLSWIKKFGSEKLDILEGSLEYPPERWNGTLTAAVEYECKPLIIKMGLQFQELDIQYTESYY